VTVAVAVGAGGACVRQRGWLAACVRLVLRRESGLVGSMVSKAAAPGCGRGRCHRAVLVGGLGCAGSKIACMGGIRGVGVLVFLPRSWRIPLDGGRYSGEPCPMILVPVTSTLSCVNSLPGGVIEDGALPPLALGENLRSG
jgi:hypothetical protein